MNQENNAVLGQMVKGMVFMTFNELLSTYYTLKESNPYRDVRLGQYFCNEYVKTNWPILYYEDEDSVAERIIYKYMLDNQWGGSLESYHLKSKGNGE